MNILKILFPPMAFFPVLCYNGVNFSYGGEDMSELGNRLKQARLASGMSQRQLCGDRITRNMLSQIENGSASPSMETLRYLARQLDKPLAWFLEEEAQISPNVSRMQQARQAYRSENFSLCRSLLQQMDAQDAMFEAEAKLLLRLTSLALAEQALEENRLPYACSLLQEATPGEDEIYALPELEHRRQLLLLRAGQDAGALPDLDDELMLRAEQALHAGDATGCRALLEAMQNRTKPLWFYLRGESAFALREYAEAALWYHRAEKELPEKCMPRLEICYRELEDYKKAYEYAAALRK